MKPNMKIYDIMKPKYKMISIMAALVCQLTVLQAQSPDYSRNFRIETSVRVSGAKDTASVNALGVQDASRTVNYYDGLGFPSQTVSVGGVCSGTRDLVQHHEYDRYMRESRVFLPYADLSSSSSAGFRSGASASTSAFYLSGAVSGMPSDPSPWSVTLYDNSTLDRVLEQGAAGEVWQPASQRTESSGRTQVYEYGSCSSTGEDTVRLWKVVTGGITSSENYLPGRLVRKTIKGADWLSGRDGTMDVYTDYNGNTVLERRWLHENGTDRALDTYYVYDVLGRLRYVLPPLLSEALSAKSTVSDNDIAMQSYSYQYRYDGLGNCIWKRLPGCSAVTMQYDVHRRMVLSRDGNQSERGEWTSIWYDKLGRPCVKAAGPLPCQGDVSKTEFTASYTGKTGVGGAAGSAIMVGGYLLYPSLPSGSELLEVIYYDSYDFIETAPESSRDSLRAYTPQRVTISIEHPDLSSQGGTPDSVILKSQTDLVRDKSLISTESSDSTVLYGITESPARTGVLSGPVIGRPLLKYAVTTEYDRYGSGRVTGKISFSSDSLLSPLYSSVYYDDKGLVIQSRSQNHLGGWDSEKTEYSFTGQPLQRTLSHKTGSASAVVEHYTYSYDNMDRVLKVTHRLGKGAETVLTDNSYDALGRLISDARNGNPALKTDYSYNIRSWKSSMSSSLFSEDLHYNNPDSSGLALTPRYDGNISASEWSFSDNAKKGYSYVYDGLGRVCSAAWLSDDNPNPGFGTSYSYDGHGNILSLSRGKGDGSSDLLTMSYIGNRLHGMTDGNGGSLIPESLAGTLPADTEHYAYDANGNMTRDHVSGITAMSYNRINLPETITVIDSGKVSNVSYSYTSDGTKQQATVTDASGESLTKDWCSNLVYLNGELDRILIPGGYIKDGSYRFFLTDHLGSVRAVADSEGNVLETIDYYPYGQEFQTGTVSDGNGAVAVADALDETLQPYRFNGKESQSFAGLPYLDYGARFYHPQSTRWTTMDPLAEKYYFLSPYAYCSGNPVNFVDPDGRKLYYAKGVSEQFKQQFAATIEFMNSKGTAGDIAKIHASDRVYYIDEAKSAGGNRFVNDGKGTKTIYWDPNHIIQFGENNMQVSPATVLAHEADHVQRYDEVQGDPSAKASYENDKKLNSDAQYGKSEERRVIEDTEQTAARKHGEIRSDQVTRSTHKEKKITLIPTGGASPSKISDAVFEHNDTFK